MIRETLAPDSRHASLFLTAGNGLAFQQRATSGGVSEHLSGGDALSPMWVKLVRKGHLFTACGSTDGMSRVQVGPAVSISMSTAVYIGLAVTSHNNSASCTSTFESVSVKQGRRIIGLSRTPGRDSAKIHL